jgi:N-dimethylarginine dimethylaminohydrolase
LIECNAPLGIVADGVINIISYDLAAKTAEQLAKRNFQIVIADESHFLKVCYVP